MTTQPAAARLLPWVSVEGKPCFLAPGCEGGYVARVADDMERVQLEIGAEVLDLAHRVLNDPKASPAELRYAGRRLAECLKDALRVAASRGMRLPVPDDTEDDEGDDEHPRLGRT